MSLWGGGVPILVITYISRATFPLSFFSGDLFKHTSKTTFWKSKTKRPLQIQQQIPKNEKTKNTVSGPSRTPPPPKRVLQKINIQRSTEKYRVVFTVGCLSVFRSTEQTEKHPNNDAIIVHLGTVRWSTRARRRGGGEASSPGTAGTRFNSARQHPGGVWRIQTLRAFRRPDFGGLDAWRVGGLGGMLLNH